ncbi:noggin-like isoform X3 [Hydra vulgaris]|uniref:Noggin-like isoform X3 n=1 Tax=Hydra vulgaris TaxID=6087 RepID=A0ABM4B6L9_HYDVU
MKTLISRIAFLLVVYYLIKIDCAALPSFSDMLEETSQKPDITAMIPLFKEMQKPSIDERNPQKLLYILGNSYDTEFSSIAKPPSMKAREPSTDDLDTDLPSSMKTHPTMSEEVLNAKFSSKVKGKKKEFGKRLTEKMQNYLWNLSKCPVKYKWIDLGENIFPQYIKRGSCSKKKTCSFPAGMTCEESKWKSVDILLYTCLKEYNSVSLDCKWRPMPVNILTECSCQCKKQTE